MAKVSVAAVDLGASSGRVMVGRVGPGVLDLAEAHRFPNVPVETNGTLYWNILGLYDDVLTGLAAAARLAPDLVSTGIDSWAVDFGLLDHRGALLSNPVHYRDHRTDGVMDRVLLDMPATELYATTGLQQLQFNTLYQLVAEAEAGSLASADRLLMIPDLLAYWLTGSVGAEVTNASTTQLLDVHSREWAAELLSRLGIPARIMPNLREPGSVIGTVRASVAEKSGLPEALPVTAVGSHDTASAVVAVPARDRHFAYISCGTWSLVGVELDEPVLTDASRAANFTNEGGVDGRIRYLRNVMGLWLLQESVRSWEASGMQIDLPGLLAEAANVAAFRFLVDADDGRFLPTGDMPERIAQACRDHGSAVPSSPAEFTRCVLDSLALAHRRTVRAAIELSGARADVIHIVGGGAQNELLCQLTADACGLPVVAGPVEATALGNVLIQGRAHNAIEGTLENLRALVAGTQPVRRHDPHGSPELWDVAEYRVARPPSA